MVETFFKSIKAELIWRNRWETRRKVEGAIFQYINGFYNPRRRHSSLAGKSPLAFERKTAWISSETGTQAWEEQFKTVLFYVVYVTYNPLGILATMKLYVAVIRQTALEMCGVPENLKEAAVAFIVFKWQLLKDTEIP